MMHKFIKNVFNALFIDAFYFPLLFMSYKVIKLQ